MTKNDYYDLAMDGYKPVMKLISMAPADKLNWRPGPTFMSLGQLVCHLGGGLGEEMEMLLGGNWASMEQMAKDMKLENLPSCSVQESLDKLEKDKKVLRAALDGLSEAEFAGKIVETPWGWKGKMERMAISFYEHMTNHKMQLFTYLKLLGLPVNTETLYFG